MQMETDADAAKSKRKPGPRHSSQDRPAACAPSYDDVVKQGVPDRFADLLQQLDKPDDEGSARMSLDPVSPRG